MTSLLTEEEEKAKNLSKVKNKQEMVMVDLEGKRLINKEENNHITRLLIRFKYLFILMNKFPPIRKC